MAQKKVRLTPPKLDEVHQVSPKLQANMDRFVRLIGHLILVKVNPETVRRMAEE